MREPEQLELDLGPQHRVQPPSFARCANERQVGGDHYKKHTIQPWDAICDWELGFLDGNVVKYIARWRNKDGLKDLHKARHYLDKLIEDVESQL